MRIGRRWWGVPPGIPSNAVSSAVSSAQFKFRRLSSAKGSCELSTGSGVLVSLVISDRGLACLPAAKPRVGSSWVSLRVGGALEA